ncbi:hypothetical protein Anas_06054, partial [Armadillidium nasatum]
LLQRLDNTMLLFYLSSVLFSVLGINSSELLEVICPPFEESDNQNNIPYITARLVPGIRSSNNEYCQCSLTEHGTAKTAILKCEFNDEKDIIIKDSLFPFKNYSVTSAYVRMKNTRSATITGDFLSSWMDAPSSALDLWHCGNVELASLIVLSNHFRPFSYGTEAEVPLGLRNAELGRSTLEYFITLKR